MIDTTVCLRLLSNWAEHAERFWYPMPDEPALGCYGTGYNAWGVQTNQKYLGAMAVLASFGERADAISPDACQHIRERALSALRFSLRSHHAGDYHCTDGTNWGHTWISALGIERMMHGVYLLEPYLSDHDRAGLRRVLTSEADWLLHHHTRGGHSGVMADPWNHSGKNVPESNLWNGALLWRAAAMYPDHLHAPEWQEQAHRFLVNSVSVPADAADERIMAGRPISEWFVGANFFPNYALDHHGYLNVGYMVICLSNAAMLHYDMQSQNLPVPESLYHHNADLWNLVRRLIFSDGRLARIGGDTRIRYAYCQEYLLPVLVYAADQLGEQNAVQLVNGQLRLIQDEAVYGGDGSFYGKRLETLADQSPYYYTRLESDRAAALGMLVTYWRQFQDCAEPSKAGLDDAASESAFETSVSGGWCDRDHGAVLHRGPNRLASFAWRAQGLAQGMCQPPYDGHLAEWWQNLGGVVRFMDDSGDPDRQRRLAFYHIDTFDGGFVTAGQIAEGVDVTLTEGWRGAASADHQIAFVALPDGHTVLGFQHCRTLDHRTYVIEVKGLHFNLPNDLYNGFHRRLIMAERELTLSSPTDWDDVVDLGGDWVNVEGRLGVIGLYGASTLVVHRCRHRRGGKYRSLYVDEICWRCDLGTRSLPPRRVILDVGWAVLSDVGREGTSHFVRNHRKLPARDSAEAYLRGVRVRGLDGRNYVALTNFGSVDGTYPATDLRDQAESAQDLATGELFVANNRNDVTIGPCQARVLVLNG